MVKALIPSILAFLSGGLAGAVFTWWINFPTTTTLAYSFNTSVIGLDAESKTATPDLTIKMRGRIVGTLYVHAFRFSVPKGGYVDEAEIAILFPGTSKGSKRSFNISTSTSSPLHKLSCASIETGARCLLGPLAPQHAATFSVTVATEEPSSPTVMAVAKELEVVSIAQFVAAEERRWMRPEHLVLGFSAFALVVVMRKWFRAWQSSSGG